MAWPTGKGGFPWGRVGGLASRRRRPADRLVWLQGREGRPAMQGARLAMPDRLLQSRETGLHDRLAEKRTMTSLILKVVIRCRDFAVSRDFYARVLGLPAIEEWDEPQGKGCIFAFGEDRRGGWLEVYAMTERDARFDPRFREPVPSDKIDVQLRTDAVDAWAEKLRGVWPFEGPDDLPWGQRWIRLRDPDGLLIAIYQDL